MLHRVRGARWIAESASNATAADVDPQTGQKNPVPGAPLRRCGQVAPARTPQRSTTIKFQQAQARKPSLPVIHEPAVRGRGEDEVYRVVDSSHTIAPALGLALSSLVPLLRGPAQTDSM